MITITGLRLEHSNAKRDPLIILLGLRSAADSGGRTGCAIRGHGADHTVCCDQCCGVVADPYWRILRKSTGENVTNGQSYLYIFLYMYLYGYLQLTYILCHQCPNKVKKSSVTLPGWLAADLRVPRGSGSVPRVLVPIHSQPYREMGAFGREEPPRNHHLWRFEMATTKIVLLRCQGHLRPTAYIQRRHKKMTSTKEKI